MLSSRVYPGSFSDVNAQLAQNAYSAALTKFGYPKLAWPATSKNNPYEAWPFGNVFYDSSIDKVCLVYNSRADHTAVDGGVYFRSKSDYGVMSSAVLIAAASAGVGRRCHGAGICANGDYVALVMHHGVDGSGPLYVYRSTNDGASWTGAAAVVDGAGLTVGETGDCYKLASGRLLTFARLVPSPATGTKVLYSDDNGATWTSVEIDEGTAPDALEGKFCELSDGTVVCFVRGNLYTGVFTVKEPTYMMTSADGGSTWTALVELADIDATFNPVGLVYHSDIKAIEFIYGSRYIREDGYGSLYQRIATDEQVKAGNLGIENRIGIGSPNGNFGYVGACKSASGVVNAFFYDGSSGTDIWNIIGNRASYGGQDLGNAMKTMLADISALKSIALENFIVYDEFDRADAATLGTAPTGQAWVETVASGTGVFGISGKQAYNVATPFSARAVIDSGVSNCIIRATLAVFPASEALRVIFRRADNSNEMYIHRNSTGYYDIAKRVANTWTVLGVSTIVPANGDKLKIVCAGSLIKLFVNNVLALTVTETDNLTNTIHGFYNDSNVTARVENFSVEAI